MDYKVIAGRYYLRIDKNEEILRTIMTLCKNEEILSATFHGIGACGEICIATYLAKEERFLEHKRSGLFELISLDGNIIHEDKGELFEHTHAIFSYLNENGEVCTFGGHLKSAVVSYTAEIVIDPIPGNGIGRMTDPHTGIPVWKLS